jgi:hypothetical protein
MGVGTSKYGFSSWGGWNSHLRMMVMDNHSPPIFVINKLKKTAIIFFFFFIFLDSSIPRDPETTAVTVKQQSQFPTQRCGSRLTPRYYCSITFNNS